MGAPQRPAGGSVSQAKPTRLFGSIFVFKRQLKGAITVYCSGSYIFAHTQPSPPAQQITPWTIHANARTREMANACVGQRKAMGESPLCSLSLVCGMYARRRASRNGPDSLARHCSRNASADACNFL